jgi:hypothetical protein
MQSKQHSKVMQYYQHVANKAAPQNVELGNREPAFGGIWCKPAYFKGHSKNPGRDLIRSVIKPYTLRATKRVVSSRLHVSHKGGLDTKY